MKKVLKMEGLDCAQCAAKMEAAISKLEGVSSASVSFMTQRLTVEADEAAWDAILARIGPVCKRIEPDCRVIWNGKAL